MDEKFVDQVKRNKQEMLQTATQCFSMAAKCDPDLNEDKWLHNYMLGKCGEKARKPLKDYLPYYLKVRDNETICLYYVMSLTRVLLQLGHLLPKMRQFKSLDFVRMNIRVTWF